MFIAYSIYAVSLDNEIHKKKQPLFRLMLTFQLRLKSSSERSV